jgi:hypothetical protein
VIALRGLLAAALAFGGAGSAAAYDRLPRGLAGLTPVEVVERIHVDDGSQEPHIVVSTENAWDRGRGIDGAHADDVHLRALVDRKDGSVRWQVWHDLIRYGTMPDIVGVDYRAAGRLQQTGLVMAEHRFDDCPGVDALMRSCNRHSRFVFEVPQQVVEEIAATYRPGNRAPWPLHFTDENGGAIGGGLAPAEAAGLLQAVDEIRRERIAGG